MVEMNSAFWFTYTLFFFLIILLGTFGYYRFKQSFFMLIIFEFIAFLLAIVLFSLVLGVFE